MSAETIVAAACQVKGVVFSMPPPARHHTVMQALDAIVQRESFVVRPAEQGFLTSTGRYVGRREAAGIAIAAGQIAETKWGGDLFSEDLW